jgi:polyphosphate kinase
MNRPELPDAALPAALVPVPTMAAPALPALLNRERAILAFNRRVLAQARRADVPLLERLRYITIMSSNMDEFFATRCANPPPKPTA